MIETKRNDFENEEQYLWRLGQAKDSGLLELDWKGIADLINKEFRSDETEYRTESAYRKAYSNARRFYDSGVFDSIKDDGHTDDIEEKKRELEKEKIKYRDERNDYVKAIRTEARKESYADMVKRIICENTPPLNIEGYENDWDGECYGTDLLCHFTDVHTGIEIENFKNTFNEDVLKERVEKYTQKVLDIRKLHHSENCYLVIGEIVSGIIHPNLRLQNNLDLMEQFKLASELIAAMMVEFSKEFKSVHLYVTPGNHSRVTPKKEEALDGENMDVLLPFYLRARLQNIDNIHIWDNTVDPEIAVFGIRGTKVFAAHGHKDSPKDVVQNLTMMVGMKPDIVLLGHRHTNGLTTVSDTKVIQSGCVSGTDEYAMSIRKTNKPEQTVSVISDDGLVCIYDVRLD